MCKKKNIAQIKSKFNSNNEFHFFLIVECIKKLNIGIALNYLRLYKNNYIFPRFILFLFTHWRTYLNLKHQENCDVIYYKNRKNT